MLRRPLPYLLLAVLLVGCGQKASESTASNETGGKPESSASAGAPNADDSNIKWGKNASADATLDGFNAKLGPLVKQGNDLITTVVEASKNDPKKNLGPALNEALPKLKETVDAIDAIPCPEGTVFINQEMKSMFEDIKDKLELYKVAIGNGVYDDVAKLEAEVSDTAKTHVEALKPLLEKNGFDEQAFQADVPKLVKK